MNATLPHEIIWHTLSAAKADVTGWWRVEGIVDLPVVWCLRVAGLRVPVWFSRVKGDPTVDYEVPELADDLLDPEIARRFALEAVSRILLPKACTCASPMRHDPVTCACRLCGGKLPVTWNTSKEVLSS